MIAFALGALIILVLVAFVFMNRSADHTQRATLKVTIATKPEELIAHDFETLRAIIKDKKSSSKQLEEALLLILKYYGAIHPKLGLRAHPEFDKYTELIIRLCHHPQATSKIVVNFDKELRKQNPQYEHEINDAITKGLNSRV